MMNAQPLTLTNLDITDTDLYVHHGYPWAAWDLLRQEAPVFWYERPHHEPFWAITKHEDIRFISRSPELFSNTQLLRMSDTESIHMGQRGRVRAANRFGGSPEDPPDFIFLDPPEHRQHRSLVSKHFTPRMMRSLEDHFGHMAENYVSHFAEVLSQGLAEKGRDGEVDVVHELSAKLPVAAICEMAGVPESDWDKIFHWTETLVGAADPEYQLPGENREQTLRRSGDEWRRYNEQLIARRKSEGLDDDLLSSLLKAEVDGHQLSAREISAYFTILLAAGNETTRNSITGGIKALIDHPDQLKLLAANPELVPSAVEEILRWTSIVIQFQRTAMEDVVIRDQQIRKGESVVMWYPSANRDEDVFPEPYRFDITRDPNDHFAFGGYGEHFCLGANLARWEMRAIFHALLPILPKLALAGEPEMVPRSLHVGGIKRMLVRSAG
jgi:cholest-4-en-3-one 26-monooxygenase|tara:strand:+ start:215 stop:1534 length:1320 start_codon:yes stop_codon:yes gene_type:complete